MASSGIKMTTGAGGMNRKSGTPNPLTMAGKLEHALVAQTIKEIIGPRFTDQVRREAEGRRGGEAKKYLFNEYLEQMLEDGVFKFCLEGTEK